MASEFALENGVVLRRARRADLLDLLRLVRAYYRFDHIDFDAASVAAGLRTLLKNADVGQAWLMERGHRPLGYVVCTFGFDLEFGGRQATITDLYLHPHFRGRGLGRATLGLLERELRKAGVRALELQVTQGNRKVLGFYKRLGFETHARIPLSKRIFGDVKTLKRSKG